MTTKTKPRINVLDSAQKIEPTSAKTSGPDRKTPGIRNLAVVQAFEKIIKELKLTVERPIKEEALDYFVKLGCALGRRPPNYNGIELGTHGSIQLKKRSSQYTLGEAKIDYLKLYGVETETITEYVLNPKYAVDESVIAKLNKIGISDIFEKREKTVSTENSIHQAFQHNDPIVAKEVLQLVTTPITIRAVIDDDTDIITQAFKLLTG